MRGRLAASAIAPAIVFAIASIAFERQSRAADDDGLYGRFDGDLTLHVGAGAALAKGGPELAARLEALYLSTAGVYGHYADALGQRGADIERSISVGVALQPLFLARFALDVERGPARLDLFLDSFLMELGAYWHMQKEDPRIRGPGLELALGMSFPLFAQATGPFLDVRAALRFRSNDLYTAAPSSSLIDRGSLLTFSLSWHHVIPVHIVDAGDRSPR